jgi:predicted ATPase
MLEKIRVRNYKAFEDASIPIKPITILLGANSVGKSSIVQLMLLLQQTAKEDFKSYKSALKLYGGSVNLGSAKNLFRKQDIGQPLKFSFSVKSTTFSNYLKDLRQIFTSSLTEITHYVPLRGFFNLRNNMSTDTRKDFLEFIDRFLDVLQKEHSYKTYIERIKYFLSREHLYINSDNLNKSDLLRIYDFLDKISSSVTSNKEFDYNFKICYKKNNLVVQQFRILCNEKTLIGFTNDKEDRYIFSDYVKFTEKENSEILNYFNESYTIFNCFSRDNKQDSSTIISYVINILSEALQHLQKEFSESSINYVSPLRAHPKRYYMLDKAKMNITLDTLDGDAIADVLKDTPLLKKNVNDWFNNFNLSINVEEFKEVVHHLRVKQNGLNLDITDVGFGISQVLPVIIQGFLSADNSTTIIEQPEIHLHPKMQADLADLFIAIVKSKKKKKLIIETHSEYILKRLRRRISEGEIDANDVGICIFYPQTAEKGAEIKSLSIEKRGYFEYPIDFYGEELEKDITEFLKNQ